MIVELLIIWYLKSFPYWYMALPLRFATLCVHRQVPLGG